MRNESISNRSVLPSGPVTVWFARSMVICEPGFELLDKQKLGSSTFQQQIAYQRALEGQISQTIGQIDGISGAQPTETFVTALAQAAATAGETA